MDEVHPLRSTFHPLHIINEIKKFAQEDSLRFFEIFQVILKYLELV
jgi:hypothetical protein